jgi:hypothetical membrane protein
MMNWKRIGAWCGILAGVQFVIVTFIIMAIYPEGYSFLENYFSELGLSETNGYPTPLNWFLFATATTLAGAFSIPFWLTIRTLFTETTPLRIIGYIGTILGIAAGPCLAGVGIFAADLFGLAHGLSTVYFFILFSLAIGVYSFGILLNSEYENIYSLIGIIVAIICLTHIFLIGGAAMQKLAVYSLILYSVFQGHKLLKTYE